jgi:hypothetical protein
VTEAPARAADVKTMVGRAMATISRNKFVTKAPKMKTSTEGGINWLKIGVAYRGRFEHPSATGIVSGYGDGYYLSRLRLNVTISPEHYLKFFVEGHDGHSLGYDSPVKPKNFNYTFDLRQAYVEVSTSGNGHGITFRVGRQELSYGAKRLVAAPDWSNTSRTIDAAVISLARPGIKVHVFASSVVQIDPGRFDRQSAGDNFYGSYAVLDKLVPQARIEPNPFWKTLPRVAGERGDYGDSDIFTGGFRFLGKLPGRVDYPIEIARQWGTIASDRLSAFAGSHTVGWTASKSVWKSRISAEFSHASGDTANRDGRRGTFDQLYPSNHINYGIADVVGWRNIHDVRTGFDFKPHKTLQTNVDLHEFFLATVHDGLYSDGGSRLVLNRAATSRHVGSDLDCFFTCDYSKRIGFGAGYAFVFFSEYLKQSVKVRNYSCPYILWNIKFVSRQTASESISASARFSIKQCRTVQLPGHEGNFPNLTERVVMESTTPLIQK